MSQIKIDALAPVGKLFLTVPNTENAKTLRDALDLFERCPEIRRRIKADQDAAGRRAKKERLGERRWRSARTPCLPLPALADDEIAADQLRLGEGRPRLPADATYVFLVMRGEHGSVSDRGAVERLLDSVTIRVWLANRNLKTPGATTVLENVNVVSNETREFILDAQLGMVLEDGLDDFSRLILDSTAVKANSAWPTDAGMLYGLLSRAYHYIGQLPKLGMPPIAPRWCPRWQAEMKGLVFRINTAKTRGNRRKLYRRLFSRSGKLAAYLRTQYQEVLLAAGGRLELPPRLRRRLDELLERIGTDLEDAGRVQDYATQRIVEDKTIASTDKVLSLADPDARFIQKGNREAVIGYKPQLARSGNGFVTTMRVAAGNTADAPEALPLVLESLAHTTVLPERVTADDGYTSGKNRQALQLLGVKDIIFTGAKGKKITPIGEWENHGAAQARNNRSAVESLMFTLKFVHDFGCLRRRGLSAVRAELLEKVIAYNFRRMSQVRELRTEDEHRKTVPKVA